MPKSTVFCVQEPMRKNGFGKWVSKGLNLAAASEYGELHIVWGPDTSVLQRQALEDDAELIAQMYDEDRDYVIALGSPSLIALLGWAIGREGKILRVLEWDRALQRYYATLGDTLITERTGNGNR